MSGISLETPLAEQLNAIVHQKITEEGWSTEEDTSLAEYIVLMLVNGKTQDQISSELASELLQDVDGIPQFAQWLSDQVVLLKNGGEAPASSISEQMADTPAQAQPEYTDNANEDIPAAYDTDMGDSAPDNALVGSKNALRHDADSSDRPKGPKNLHGSRGGRGGRIGGQMNKTMDRSGDSVLHRVKGQAGAGRIDSHTRGTPKGPRGGANRAGLQKALSGIATGNPAQAMSNPMMQAGGQANPLIPAISPQQQMEFMAMMEQQARMMAQFTGMVPGAMSPGFQQNGQPPNGQQGSLFDRVQAPGRGGRGARARGRGAHHNGTIRNGSALESTGADSESNAPSSSMEVESTSQPPKSFDPSTTMCRFNKRCINQDCPYAHVSPAAPDNTTIDMTDICSFGVACKNSKCTARHPSPAQLKAHHAEEVCKFFPNCANPVCSYKHPNAPPCRFGADCTREGCTFTHMQIACRFNPCTNRTCPYKHAEGQKGKIHSNVWVSEAAKKDTAMGGAEDGQHVSNRKFVEDGAEEELIKPEESVDVPLDENDVENIGAAQAEGIIA